MYYDYDQLARVIHIRDNDRKIIKKICYNYAGQEVDCGSGRMNVNVMYYGLLKSDMCNPDTTQFIDGRTLYSNYDEDIEYDLLNGSLDSLVYTDMEMTVPAPTGYYVKVPESGPTFPRFPKFYYVVDGKLIFTNRCGFADPYVLMFADTLSDMGLICEGSFPVLAAYPSNDSGLIVGQHLYTNNLSPLLPIPDGYYKLSESTGYFKIVAGEITEVLSCEDPVFVQEIELMYEAFVWMGCPLSFTFPYYYLSPTLDVGVTLFQDSALTTSVSAGVYSDGYYRLDVNYLGKITSKTSCF